MAPKHSIKPVRFFEESGKRFAVLPEEQLRRLIARMEDLEDALELKQAVAAGGDFVSLDELDEELAKTGLK
jgi:hypothetical protein